MGERRTEYKLEVVITKLQLVRQVPTYFAGMHWQRARHQFSAVWALLGKLTVISD